jgi:RecB family exonuclease
MQRDGRYILSVSQIDTYLRCPLDFYYVYVLGMPTEPTPVRAYGTIIHGVIEQLQHGLQNGALPNLDDLEAAVKSKLPTAGYISPRSRERAHAQALQTVRNLYDRFITAEAPLEIEKPFRAELPDAPLTIIGRIDAVYQLPDGVEIRDYKTGSSVTDAVKAKSRATGSNQLALYALAWLLQHDEMPALLTLDFVETGQIGTVKKQAKSMETLQARLAGMCEALRAGRYEPGKDHAYCSHPLRT